MLGELEVLPMQRRWNGAGCGHCAIPVPLSGIAPLDSVGSRSHGCWPHMRQRTAARLQPQCSVTGVGCAGRTPAFRWAQRYRQRNTSSSGQITAKMCRIAGASNAFKLQPSQQHAGAWASAALCRPL